MGNNSFYSYLNRIEKVFELVKENHVLSENISHAITLIAETLKKGNKILIAGNGGSAADAQHFATEFIVRLDKDDKRQGLPVMALTTNSSTLTAAANDLGFEFVFSRQVEAFGVEGDLFIGISTSGHSYNIINAFTKAKELRLKTILLTGNNNISEDWNIILSVPNNDTNIIQMFHSIIEHFLVKESLNLLFFEK